MPISQAGSTNLAAIGVPNVLVQITPPNPLLNGVPTDIVGVVGTAQWGPTNAPVTIGSLQQLVSVFGNPSLDAYDMPSCVYAAMQQSANNFRCVRVTDGTDVAASASMVDTQSPSPSPGVLLTSIYTGVLGNTTNAQFSIGSGSTPGTPTYKLTVWMSGGVPEVFDNIGGTGQVFWQNVVNAVNLGQSIARGPSQLVVASLSTGISSVTVTAPGSYTTLPTLGTTGPGSGAVLNPVMFAESQAIVSGGTGYVAGDTLLLAGGTFTAAAVLTVNAASQVHYEAATIASIADPGSGYAATDTITLTGGTAGTYAVITVDTVDGGGAILTAHISTAGDYTVRPVNPVAQGSTSGVGVNATFNLTFNVLSGGVISSASISTPGSYTALPANPVSQNTSSGFGLGATFTMGWGLLSVNIPSHGSGYTNSSVFTASPTGATGTLVIGSQAAPAYTLTPLAGGTNGNGAVTSATLVGLDTGSRTGMYALRKTGASIIALANASDPTQWSPQVVFGLSEGAYMIATIAAGYQDNITGAISLKQTAAIDSYAMKLLNGDWCQFYDPFNSQSRFISPQGFVCGILATQIPSGSSLNKPMQAIVATQKTNEMQIYSDADLLQLETGNLDVVTKPIPASASSFGVRLGINTSSNAVTNGDNYTRMINFLALTFINGLGPFIGQPQTPQVRLQAKATLDTFLQNLAQLGMIGNVNGGPAFKVILDDTNNPFDRVALGYMQADVQVTLFSIIQQFVVNLQAGQSVNIQTLPPQLL
jgi:hypothetical protein